jgi:hypothetical protein
MVSLFKKKPKYNIKVQVQVILNDNNVLINYFYYQNVKDKSYGMKQILNQFKTDNMINLGEIDSYHNMIPMKDIKRVLFKTEVMKEINNGTN